MSETKTDAKTSRCVTDLDDFAKFLQEMPIGSMYSLPTPHYKHKSYDIKRLEKDSWTYASENHYLSKRHYTNKELCSLMAQFMEGRYPVTLAVYAKKR